MIVCSRNTLNYYKIEKLKKIKKVENLLAPRFEAAISFALSTLFCELVPFPPLVFLFPIAAFFKSVI
jgi:hypothetical protein